MQPAICNPLAPNDVFLTLDGGRSGNATTMKQAFTYVPPGQMGNNRLLMAEMSDCESCEEDRHFRCTFCENLQWRTQNVKLAFVSCASECITVPRHARNETGVSIVQNAQQLRRCHWSDDVIDNAERHWLALLEPEVTPKARWLCRNCESCVIMGCPKL